MCWRLISIPRLQNRAPVPYAFQLIVQSLLNRVWLCDPINCSTLGFPVLHYLPEFAQTRVYRVDVAIQPSHLLLPTSPPALNLSQHWGYVYKLKIIHCLFEIQIQLKVLYSTWQ